VSRFSISGGVIVIVTVATSLSCRRSGSDGIIVTAAAAALHLTTQQIILKLFLRLLPQFATTSNLVDNLKRRQSRQFFYNSVCTPAPDALGPLFTGLDDLLEDLGLLMNVAFRGGEVAKVKRSLLVGKEYAATALTDALQDGEGVLEESNVKNR